MPIKLPELTEDGYLPLGRFPCSLAQLEERFVDHDQFSESETREDIFTDLLDAVEIVRAFSPELIEGVWVGGSFVTSKPDPDDIDCLFILNAEAFDGITSNRKREKLTRLNRKGYLRETHQLRVESFLLVRRPFANPWVKDGVHDEVVPYVKVRGAWDDWWLRARTGETSEDEPRIESAEPRRGYLEVTV